MATANDTTTIFFSFSVQCICHGIVHRRLFFITLVFINALLWIIIGHNPQQFIVFFKTSNQISSETAPNYADSFLCKDQC